MKNFRNIPAIDEMLIQEKTQVLLSKYQREFVVDMLRMATEEVRRDLAGSKKEWEKAQLLEIVLNKAEKNICRLTQGTLQKVINATGVVLHTNLGRAPLSKRAINYLNEMAVNYNNLEMDLQQGLRGSRYWHIEELLTRLTGAEAALVVNNNAAAVLLGLNTMAKGREVIVSRGQLVEIGGAFRIPEVMKLSGARLVEVGTTNRTYISDYAGAVTEETALLFTAHTSNYKIMGFTEEVPVAALVKLGREKGVPVMHDLGSGILYQNAAWGLSEEPSVGECVEAGADIITFSGDKLLGGPQAGIILGKKTYIDAMKKNQLTRALRVDKLTIAALEGTLIEYLSGHPRENIPVIQMLDSSEEKLHARAEHLADMLQAKTKGLGKIKKLLAVEVEDMVGGGAYPTHKITGWGIEIEFNEIPLNDMARRLRVMNPALLTRKQDDKMLLSVRTLLPGDEERIVEMIARALGREEV
ncbi:MAG: L-seryl-tRNA(Sec) selenium transferase [Syntrophomonadaceae bacterium]|nr:L-seryl-tRNA(Sec) selenium transferase [Syntrophomonadaceae bacterium]MDD3023533.1 L-seryl-tRNA(Sec) selenium transferase [Syntrophomonadaceae bacterium]